jgi:hypothetical protein
MTSRLPFIVLEQNALSRDAVQQPRKPRVIEHDLTV